MDQLIQAEELKFEEDLGVQNSNSRGKGQAKPRKQATPKNRDQITPRTKRARTPVKDAKAALLGKNKARLVKNEQLDQLWSKKRVKTPDANYEQEENKELKNSKQCVRHLSPEPLCSRDTNKEGVILEHGVEKPEKYTVGKVLGSGMIGVACLCSNNQGILKCLKYMSVEKIREKNLFKNIKDEVLIMYELIGVPGVCQIEDIIINEEKDITIVLPFYALTDLWNYMKVKPGRHLNEKDSRKVFYQLVRTFEGIHTRHIMHRDIKPENILVRNDELDICLSDFGLATRVGPYPKYEKTRTGQAGTPCYYSYEIVKKIPYDERVDIWCLGVLLFEMLFGALPFSHDANDARDYSASISSLKFRFPSKSSVSQEARDLINKILVPQDKRISLTKIKEHPWSNLDLDLHF